MAESPIPSLLGDHQLTETFGAVSAIAPGFSRRPRKRRTGLVLTAVGVVVIGGVCGGIQLAANLGYDDALLAFDAAALDATSAQSSLASESTALNETMTAASAITAADSGTLMDAATKDALATAVGDADSAASEITELTDTQIPDSTAKPDWAWELFGATAQLNSDHQTANELVDEFESAGQDAGDSTDAVATAGTDALTAAAEAAAGFEAAHISARNLDILALRSAATRVTDSAATLDDTASNAYASLEAAAAQVLLSEKAELAEKTGPLNSARVEIEAFARDLAPGVLLDFDWSQLVNGYGYSDSMGGLATWWYGDPGYANLELSNSVAQYWPSDRSKSLVAHEVGHAISVKCQGMYDDSNQDTIEAWATAWAISKGFHSEANGTSAYGPPPQSLIDAAAKCR